MSSTFLGLPAVDAAALAAGDADAVILGVPFGVPYPTPGQAAGCAEAPAAIRARSQRLARFVGHHDFDLDGPMLPPDASYRVADAGDVAGSPQDGPANSAATEAVVRQILARRRSATAAGWRRFGADPLPPRLRRPRADHRRPGRCPPRLPRRGGRCARRLLVGHAPRFRDGARRAHRAGRAAWGGQRATLGRCRRPRCRQPVDHRSPSSTGAACRGCWISCRRIARWWWPSTWTGWTPRSRRR